MLPKTKFSVIIPFYNSAGYLSEIDKSIKSNCSFIDEVIFVDDCSHDDASNILIEYCKLNSFKYFRNKKNSGPSFSRNFGVSMSSSKFLAFLDSDDSWSPGRLARAYEVLNAEQSPYYINSYDDRGMIFDSNSFARYYKLNFFFGLFKNRLQPSCFCCERSSFLEFSSDMRYSEDFDLYLRILQNDNVFFDESVLTFLGRPQGADGGLSSNKFQMRLGEMKAYCLLAIRTPYFYLLLPFLLSYSFAKHFIGFIYAK